MKSYQQTIQDLRQQLALANAKLAKANWDDSFGMYSSFGLFQRLSELSRNTPVFITFIDLDNIHGLNAQRGYEKVNNDVHAIFRDRRNCDIMGRRYSGDELVLITEDNPKHIIKKFSERGQERGIAFHHATGIATQSDANKVLDALAANVSEQKAKRPDTELRLVG